jgi:hypothetical protein
MVWQAWAKPWARGFLGAEDFGTFCRIVGFDLNLSDLTEDLRQRIRPVWSSLFPRQVLLELHDDGLRGQVMRGGRPLPVSIEAPLPALTCSRGRPLEKEPLGDLIGDLLVRDGLLDAVVMAALPPGAVDWRVIVWPFRDWPEDAVEAVRQIDPPLHLPYPLQEATIDLHPLPGEPAQMLLVSAPTQLVDDWIDVFTMAGVHLDRLAPAQICQLAPLRDLLSQGEEDELVLLLDPRPDDCRLLMLRAGVPVFEHLLPAEPDRLLTELIRALAFYRRQDQRARSMRLLVTAQLPEQERIEAALGLPALLCPSGGYGSLVLQGLAMQEQSR